MTKQFVRPLFYTDSRASYLMDSGVRYANVFENTFGDQYFGTAHAKRESCEAEADRLRRYKPIYRVVVRRKAAQ